MRYQGKLTEWNDARGFGFVVWNGGGEKIFVHVSAFNETQRRPVVGDIVTYETSNDEKGRSRAGKVSFAVAASRNTVAEPSRRSGWVDVATVVFIAALCVGGYERFNRQVSFSTPRIAAPQNSTASSPAFFADPQKAVESTFQCAGKTHCSQMTSCEEATFYLTHCPETQMDGDNDGVPCESQWCDN